MKNQHSEQFSKSTVVDARLQNTMGLFSLVIALSLAEVGQKKKKLSLSHRKKASFMAIKLLGFKMMKSYQNIRFFGFTLLNILNSAVHQDTYGEMS